VSNSGELYDPAERELKGDPNGVNRPRGGKAEIRRHSKRLTTVTCVACLSLGLVVGGCSSASSGGAPQPEGSTGSPGTTSSCDSAAYRFHGHAPPTAGQPVLAAIQLPDPVEIPDPDVAIIDEARPPDEDPDVQETWASDQAGDAQSVAQQNQSSNQDLQTVSNEVSADEVSALLIDDLGALEAGDKDYDGDLCESIKDLNEKFGDYLDYYEYLSQVVAYLNGLAVVYNSSAPKDLAKAISDAQSRFQQALGTCVDNLETIQWIVDQIHKIFCEEGT
jgi:hypothetical protein